MSLPPGWRDEISADFVLERGGAELQSQFAEIEMRPFTTLLLVNEAAPLADYILSTISGSSEGVRPDLLAFLQKELDRREIIEIRSSSGLFIAW